MKFRVKFTLRNQLTIVTDHFSEVRESSAVVQMEMGDDDGVDKRRHRPFGSYEGEIREPPFVVEAHVHAAVQHDVFTANLDQNATAADVLSRSKRYHSDVRHGSGNKGKRSK